MSDLLLSVEFMDLIGSTMEEGSKVGSLEVDILGIMTH